MNKRIQAMAASHFPRDTEGNIHATPEIIGEFAELIVRECAKVCRDQSNEYAMELDRENCASAIEEHFGVEE